MLKRLDSFDWESWNKSLRKGIEQPYRDYVIATGKKAAATLNIDFDAKDPMLSKFMTKYVGERVVQLNDTTKELVADAIRTALASGSTEDLTEKVLTVVGERFDGYEVWRAERIARTETAIAFNHANIFGFRQAGVTEVDVVDGTDDDDCEDANGQTWSLIESLQDPIAHPNCTRSFVPIVPDDEETRTPAVERLELDDDLAFICAIASEMIVARDDPHSDRVLDAIEG